MLLQRLAEFASRLPDLPPSLYEESPVRYIVELDAAGRLLNRRLTDTVDRSSPRGKSGVRRRVPQVQRTSGITPMLLVGNAEYTLGLPRDTAKAARAAACHSAYLALVARCAQATREPDVHAVLTFLRADPTSQLDLPDDFDRASNITFRVGESFVVDHPTVQRFWAELNDPAGDGRQPQIMQCIVCGRERPVLARLKGKVKGGLPGGQASGTALISANAEAFWSYGLEASFIAPTCSQCGEGFTRAINHLLTQRENHLTVGGAAFVFWTREPNAFSPYTLLNDPQPGEVRELLRAPSTGRDQAAAVVEDTAFYATALSGSGGRAVVRDWLDTTVSEVKEHLRRWFSGQAIVGPYGEEPKPFGLYPLAACTVRDASKELAPPVPRALLRGALAGTPLPMDLLCQAVRRNRAEQKVTQPRAALIKMVLCSRRPAGKKEEMVQLDPSNDSPAYRCGRLLAVLEEVQYHAIPGAKATIVDRFFGSASSAPASVFGRLLRGAQPHLAKLRRDRPGAYFALQVRLEEIQSGLSGFPRFLTLEGQGLFALGYYHQRAHDRAQARAAKARRAAGEVAPPEADLLPEEELAAAQDAGREDEES